MGQFRKIKTDGELAYQILEKIATLELPTAGNIAASLKKDLRRINTHLNLLKILFAIDEVSPHSFSSGKSVYYLCDPGIANFLGANFEKQLATTILQEYRSQLECRGDLHTKIYFYRSLKGSLIHFVLENQSKLTFIQIFPNEKFDQLVLRLLILKLSFIHGSPYARETLPLIFRRSNQLSKTKWRSFYKWGLSDGTIGQFTSSAIGPTARI